LVIKRKLLAKDFCRASGVLIHKFLLRNRPLGNILKLYLSGSTGSMTSPDFAACGAKFKGNLSLYANYTYTGPAEGIWKNGQPPPLIILAGCEALCGTGNDYYGWATSASTILTWVMPILGMLTKAPFEKKETIRTWWTVCRWLESPIVSLAYIFWNIKVTSKCAKLIDISTPYDVVPPPDSEFADMRDSL
jgi:hypothetical protein